MHDITWQLRVMFGPRIPTKFDVSAMDKGYARTVTTGTVATKQWFNPRLRCGAYTKIGRIVEINEGTHNELDISTSAAAASLIPDELPAVTVPS